MFREKFCNYIKLIRVKHYLKNFLVFFPLVFSGKLVLDYNFFCCVISFFTFSFVSSIVYIINDLKDVKKDRLHPTKKNRPIASGAVSIRECIAIIILLIILILICIRMISMNFMAVLILLIYLIINIGYSFGLKNVPLLDIVILVMGFVLRVIFGGLVIGVSVSNWLYLTVMSFSFYLALGKRRNELMKMKSHARKVLKYYTKEFLDKAMYMCLSIGIVFYSLWTTSENIINKFNNYMIWTVPVIIIIWLRYCMIVEDYSDGDPVEVVMNDRILMLLLGVYSMLILIFIYM